MVYVETDGPNAQHRREVPMQSSQMGIDEDLLKDVLRRVRERRAQTHPLATRRPNGSHRVGLCNGAQQKQAHHNAGPTTRLTDDLCCMDFRCFDVLGMRTKPKPRLKLSNGSNNALRSNNALGRTPALPEQRDPESNEWTHSQGRTAAPPEQRDSELNGSSRSQHSSRWPRNDQDLGSPSTRSTRNPNVKTSWAETRRKAIKDKGSATGLPFVGSLLNGVSNRNLASRAPAASALGNKQVSKPAGSQSTLNPKTTQQGHERTVHAAKQGGSNASGSNFALHSTSTARNKLVSKTAGPYSMTRNEQASASPGTQSKLHHAPPVTAARINQVSKPLAVPSKLNANARMEGRGSSVHAPEQGDSNVSGSKFSLHPDKPARSKAPGLQSFFQSKAWRKMQDTAGSIGNDGSSSASASTKQTYGTRWIPLKSLAGQQEFSTGKISDRSSTTRSSSNASSNQSHVSLASSESSSTGHSSHRSGSKSSSSRDSGAFLRLNATSGSYDSAGDSVSDLSLPSTSTTQTRNSAQASRSDALNSVNPDERDGSYDSGDEDSGSEDDSSAGSHSTSGESATVVESIRSTANEILDVEDVWLSRAVLKTIAESKEVSVDELIEIVCDKLDEIDDSLFRCDGTRKALTSA